MNRQSWWMKSGFLLALIVAVAAFLRLYRLGADGLGNLYYAATVRSMLDSWHNFFFAAFEPGGSITVDKPPLGFWVQAASAALIGFNGLALALPQALGGVLAVPLLYHLVRRRFGVAAGLVAALVLAITPISVATDRNNTIDGLLLPLLLLAAWAVIRATETRRLRYLLLCALIVGLGFNVKMLQAFLPLPALFAFYLLAARSVRWRRRLAHLVLATGLLLVVSLSWAVVVDLTPPDQRPFIGSSADNTVMELIVGHNGLRRLLPGGGGGGAAAQPSPSPASSAGPQSQGLLPPGGNAPLQSNSGLQPPPPGGNAPLQPKPGLQQPLPGPGPSGSAGGARRPFNWETGDPGPLRLFREPLAAQISWLMPLAALGALVAVVSAVRRRAWSRLGELALWGTWLVTGMVFFSVANLFHRHYLEMLAAPLAAIVGVGGVALWRACRRAELAGWLLPLALVATAAFQFSILSNYPAQAAWLKPLIAGTTALAVGLLLVARARSQQPSGGGRGSARGLALGAMLVTCLAAPLTWSALTLTQSASVNANLPAAGPAPDRLDGVGGPPPDGGTDLFERLVDFLQPRTAGVEYLAATQSAQTAAPLILATHRPVLALGGFTGGDQAITVEQLADMVASGQLRYVLALQLRPDVMRWVQANCQVVSEWAGGRGGAPGLPNRQALLYDCGAGG